MFHCLYIAYTNFSIIVLDPRIGYAGLLAEAAKDENDDSREEYIQQIETAKASLKAHFLDNYLPQPSDNSAFGFADPRSSPASINFFAAYDPPEDTSPAFEVDEFMKHRPLGFGHNAPPPLSWWKNNKVTYPNLSRFARDILCIPGELSIGYQISILLTHF